MQNFAYSIGFRSLLESGEISYIICFISNRIQSLNFTLPNQINTRNIPLDTGASK